MKKFITIVSLVLAFAYVATAQSFTVSPATTNAPAGQASVISGLADNTSTNLPHTVSKSIPIFANPDGSFPTSAGVFVAITGTNAGATNVFTITLRPDYGNLGGTNLSTTQSQTITLMAGGAGTSCVVSNLSSAVFGTAKAARVTSVSVADDAGSFGGYTLRIGGVGLRN